MCGIVACVMLLLFLRMNRSERREVTGVAWASGVLLPLSLAVLWRARTYSVPPALLEMTGKGWECIGVSEDEA